MSDRRVLTQHVLTGEWLTHTLPLQDLEYGPELNGPGSLTGTLTPKLASQSLRLVDPGTTCLYVEEAGQITWEASSGTPAPKATSSRSKPLPGRPTSTSATTSTESSTAAALQLRRPHQGHARHLGLRPVHRRR